VAELPVVVVDRAGLAAALAPLRAAGRSLALVPTMGALHDAHRSLIRRAAELADVVVVSVFVNPLQFGPHEDFNRYPRSLDSDIDVCAQEGAAIVLAPSVDAMYPAGEPQVRVHAGPLGELLEGASRPGHFDGVLTVVAKLFGLVRPAVAVFGRKDAQQLALVQRMVRDLEFPVRVEAVPIVRDEHGLALSSRNGYLDARGRLAAGALSRALRAGVDAGPGGPQAVVTAAWDVLAREPGVVVDYLTLVDPVTFNERLTDSAAGATDALLLVAAGVEGTRLIDNMTVPLPVGDDASRETP
jgi:pantoate--beta-alanine ligase